MNKEEVLIQKIKDWFYSELVWRIEQNHNFKVIYVDNESLYPICVIGEKNNIFTVRKKGQIRIIYPKPEDILRAKILISIKLKDNSYDATWSKYHELMRFYKNKFLYET